MQLRVPLTFLICFLTGPAFAQTPPPGTGVRRGRITLPPKRVDEGKVEMGVATRNDPDQFYRDVIDLRRSKVLTEKRKEQLLRDLSAHYDDPAEMAVQLSSRCRSDLLYGLMDVVDRYGSKYHAEELHFQVISRPLGRVTSRVINAIVGKSGTSTKNKLFDYLVCKYSPARNAAAALLPKTLSAEDIPKLIELSQHSKSDIRRKVVSLLGGISDERIHDRLMEILVGDPAVAPDACVASIAQGEPMVAPLSALLTRPSRGKAFGYACFAMVRLERTLGRDLFKAEMVPPMVTELQGDDAFLRAASGIALGAITYRSRAWMEAGKYDKDIVESLLTVVAPSQFITSMRLLKPSASEVLVRITGQDFQNRRDAWARWWATSRKQFVALSRTVALTPESAQHAVLTWNTGEHFLAFRGPAVLDSQMPAGKSGAFLASEEMLSLVQELQGLGFMGSLPLPLSSKVWKVDMRVGASRILMRLAPSRDGMGRADKVHALFVEVARAQLWQKYRDPEAYPDAQAFWRAEREWLRAHPDQARLRLVANIVKVLPSMDDVGREQALDDLQSIEGLPGLITELHGSALVRHAKTLKKLGKSDFRLLELGVMASGDMVWRQALAVLDERLTGSNGDLATRLFRLLGPERALLSIKHPSENIALAAIHDAAATGHRAAEPVLLARMQDPDPDIQRTAIYALGVLESLAARKQLLALEKDAPPLIRREIWAALGRIGGVEVVPVLKRAMENPAVLDRLAAMTAMGYTSSGELARFLAVRYANQGVQPNDISRRVELSLRKMGPLLAAPALRQHLQMEAGPVRQRLVLFLAEQQEPLVVEDLIDYLSIPNIEKVAAQRLSEITGVDLRSVNNRSQTMRVWASYNKDKTQAQWYLAALERAQIPTSLAIEQLTPGSGVGPVPELGRLMSVVKEPHLQVLTASLLRQTTGVDFTRGVRFADNSALQAIVDRYKIHVEMIKAAGR